jgi:hypothetical protein
MAGNSQRMVLSPRSGVGFPNRQRDLRNRPASRGELSGHTFVGFCRVPGAGPLDRLGGPAAVATVAAEATTALTGRAGSPGLIDHRQLRGAAPPEADRTVPGTFVPAEPARPRLTHDSTRPGAEMPSAGSNARPLPPGRRWPAAEPFAATREHADLIGPVAHPSRRLESVN